MAELEKAQKAITTAAETAMNELKLPDNLRTVVSDLTGTFKRVNEALEKIGKEDEGAESASAAYCALDILAQALSGAWANIQVLQTTVGAEARAHQLALNELRERDSAQRGEAAGGPAEDFDRRWPAAAGGRRVLDGDDAAFATLRGTVKERVERLAAKGIALNAAPKIVADLAYAKDFEREFGIGEGVLGLSGGAGGGWKGPGGDPLIGPGAGAGGGAGGKTERKVRTL